MACRVPGCSTKYWNKNNNYTLFKAPSEKQLADWQEILRGAGVFDFNKTDKVCILHFEANCIERERVLHKRGGTVFKEPRKVPVLSYTAVPTIFPPKNPENEKKKQLNYAVVLDEEALSKQREIFKENISSDGTLPREDMKKVKRLKIDNLFNVVVNAIHNHNRVSPHLDNRWVANYLDGKCVKWSLWKADRSGIEKTINLYEDLTAELLIDEKKIFLPELENISEMADLQTLFKKVCQIVPCKRTNYDTEDSANAYMGFVVKSAGRPRSWYPPGP